MISELAKILISKKTILQTEKEASLMCRTSEVIKNGIIVEIGRCRGGSLILMCKSSPSSVVYSIDISDEYNQMVKNHLEYLNIQESQYELLEGDSTDISKTWDKEIDLIFIDGDHSENAVFKDLSNWIPSVKKNGFVLMHDYFEKDNRKSQVRNAVESYNKETNNSLKYINHKNRMRLFQKLF